MSRSRVVSAGACAPRTLEQPIHHDQRCLPAGTRFRAWDDVKVSGIRPWDDVETTRDLITWFFYIVPRPAWGPEPPT